MNQHEIPDSAIELVAKHINLRNNKNYHIPVVGNPENPETPQVFEIIPFDQIDDSQLRFYAVDGSYNSEQFYNGLSIGVYAAGYVCFSGGQQERLNDMDDPVILGQAYYPSNVLATNQGHLNAIYSELLEIGPVKSLLQFWAQDPINVFAYGRDTVCANLPILLSFCQEILEWAMVYEIANQTSTRRGDFILRDGTLRSLHIKQPFLVQLGEYLRNKGIVMLGITKQSPIKMELSYTFKQIDSYLPMPSPK